MAITIVTEPRPLLPAYTPVVYRVRTDRYPNTLAGESNIAVVSVDYPTSAQLSSFPDLKADDLLIQHAAMGSTLVVGDRVLLHSMATENYAGTHTVRKVISPAYTVIDADFVGADSGGKMDRYYQSLALLAELEIDGVRDTKPHALTFDDDGFATFDVRKRLQRAMSLTLDELDAGTLATGENKGYCRYRVFFREAYMIPVDGRPTYYDDKPGQQTSALLTAVNAAQPYAHNLNGQDYTYAEMLADYKALDVPVVGARLLTHMPRGIDIPIGRDEFARLDILFGKDIGYAPSTALLIHVKGYDSSGAPAGVHTANLFPEGQKTKYFTSGTRNMTTGWLGSSVVKYTVQVMDGSDKVSEMITYRIVPRRCLDWVRFHWRNRLGGMDSFTFEGPSSVAGSSESVITEREALDGYTAGDVAQLRTVRSKKSSELVSVQTDYIEPVLQQWLAKELCQSPEVYITTADLDQYIPVIIEDGDVQEFSMRGDRSPFLVSYRLATETIHHVR